MDFFTTVQTDRAATRFLLAIDLFLTDPALDLALIQSAEFQRVRWANGYARRRLASRQPRVGTEVTLVGDAGLRIQIAHMERTRGNTIIAANTARFIHLHDPVFITI